MKLFFLQSRTVISLCLGIVLSSASLAKAEHQDTKSFQWLETCTQYWHELENTITESVYNVVEYVEEIFHPTQPPIPQQTSKFKYDVTLVGFVNFADGIGRHPILFKECLEQHATMNFLSTRDIPCELEDAQLGLPRLDPANKGDIGAVAILTDILADKALNLYKKVPDSYIKIAYSMFESTEIPHNWAAILNHKFDMVVVPDSFFIDVYKTSGVQIPIFVLPLPLILHDFLALKQQAIPHKPFVFGMSGGFWARKNHIRVLEAFVAAGFGNRRDVLLKLHGRFGEKEVIQALADKIAEYNLTNVELIVQPYTSEEYLAFFKSLDCYVFLSMGEGFSVTPREALACGKPCIVTKNTAQITICNSGAVRVVRSDILVPAIYDCHYDNHCIIPYGSDHTKNFLQMSRSNPVDLASSAFDDEIDLLWRSANIGYQFDCTVQDAAQAMRDVYEHYSEYCAKAAKGKEWVKRYLHENLSSKYVNLVKPQSIVLGAENIIGDTFLMTNSKALYEKYRYVMGN